MKKKESPGVASFHYYFYGVIGIVALIAFIGLSSNDLTGNALKPIQVLEKNICLDSDGRYAWDTAGSVKTSDVTYYDFCHEDGYLVTDYYCADGKPGTASIDCRQLGQGFVCESTPSGARCVQETPTGCTDSDPSNNAYTLGSVYGYDSEGIWYNHPDFCRNSELIQWSCSGISPIVLAPVFCSQGCEQGVCNDNIEVR